MELKLKYSSLLLCAVLIVTVSSCDFFNNKQDKIEIPEGVTEEQLAEQRYTFKRDNAYKEKFIYQNKTDSATISIFNVIRYEMKDDGTSIGEGYEYFIFDIAIDNYTKYPFHIGSFTKSCHLSNSNPDFAYSNVGFALKMYHLQADSAQIDMEYTKRFYIDTMPAKEFYRTKLFAFEVSKEDKEPLFFRYKIGNQKYEYQVR
ncbi:MAG: hypothetical protein U0T69_13350 [Chitinophagales bacterium]